MKQHLQTRETLPYAAVVACLRSYEFAYGHGPIWQREPFLRQPPMKDGYT